MLEYIENVISSLLVNDIAHYVMAVLILVVTYVLSYVVTFLLEKMKHITSVKTKTTLDDKIIHAIIKPIHILFLLTGAFFAVLYVKPDFKIEGMSLSIFFNVAYILIGAYIVVRIAHAILDWYGEEIAIKTKTKVDTTSLPLLKKIAGGIIYILALLIIFDKLGIEITPLIASLGIAGLAVALALQDTLANFFAGVYMGIERQIKIGDYVEIGPDLKGYVDDISWRTTRIRTLGNNYVVIPNSKLAQSIFTNYSKPAQQMSVVIPVGVSYNSDLEKVEKVTIEVAKKVMKETEGTVKDFEPFIRFKEFGESSINFSVILRVEEYVNQYLLKHNFIKELHKRYRKEGIEIPFPQMDVWIKEMRSGAKK
ncbi:MAG: mechanosensitive ion channel family protein [Candidatus Aenigmarchaeota archaeon]|nr:mechanosensitive ion channel family protein [Candidatus Aenigmarchaeota archaeon]